MAIKPLNIHYSMESNATVYDEEALTALQLAARTTAAVNECIEHVNRIPADIAADVKKHIDGGTFDKQIDEHTATILKQIDDTEAAFRSEVNELTNEVNAAEATLGARVDNLLGSLEPGSATGDAELIDLRTGANGHVYANAGEAIRDQFLGVPYKVKLYDAHFNYDTLYHTLTITGANTASVLCSALVGGYIYNFNVDFSSLGTYWSQHKMQYFIVNIASKTWRIAETKPDLVQGDVVLFSMNAPEYWMNGLDEGSFYVNGRPYIKNFIYHTTTIAKCLDGNFYVSGGTLRATGSIFMHVLTEDRDLNFHVDFSDLAMNGSKSLTFLILDYEADTYRVVTKAEYVNNPVGETEIVLAGCYDDKVWNICLYADDIKYSGESAVTQKTMHEVFAALGNASTTTKIVLGGDSITHGNGGTGFAQNGEDIIAGFKRNPNGVCWANKFKAYIEANYNATVTNNACSGTYARWWADRMANLVPADTDIFILTIGTNDRTPRSGENKAEQIAQYYAALAEIAYYCKGNNINLVLCCPPPVTHTNDAGNGQVLNISDLIPVIYRVCSDYGVPCANIYNEVVKWLMYTGESYSALLPDGLHPGDRMHGLLLNFYQFALGLGEQYDGANLGT